MIGRTIVSGLVALVALGCAGDRPEPAGVEADRGAASWQVVTVAELVPEQRAQLERAERAKNLLASTLMDALTQELEVGGPAGAVDICRDMAPMISAHAAEENGVRLGRTSFRVRNPANRPPEWARGLVADRVAELTTLAGPEGELGVMMPIRLAEPCLACHGPRESLDQAVVAALAESYPDDEAVGFAEGDLRGWFWVEVPPA
jgi:hypothetical protein